MKFKKIMLATFMLLAILTIGAVSASDDALADGNLTATDIAEDPIEEASVDEVIAETPQQEVVGVDAEDFNVWLNNNTLDIDNDTEEIAITFTSPEGAEGDFDIFIDGSWSYCEVLSNETSGKTFNVTFGELWISEPGSHSVSFRYDYGDRVDAGTLFAYKEYLREDFDTGIFENVGDSSYRLYYLYEVPAAGTFVVYVNGEERYREYNGYKTTPIYVGDLNITYNDYFNITTEYVINSTGQVVALDSFIAHVYCMPISVLLTDSPITISKGYDSVGYVSDNNYIDGTVLVYVDSTQIYAKAFSAADEVTFASFDMDELKLKDNITHGNHTIKIVYQKNGDVDYSKEGLVEFHATAKISAPSEINQGEDKYITVTYLEGTSGNVTVILGEKEPWGDGPYEVDFYEGALFTVVDVVNGVAKIPLKTLPAGYQGLFLDMVIGEYTDYKLVRIDVKGTSPTKTVLSASKVSTTYGTSKNLVVTLKDANGKVLKNKKVTVKLNGKTYSKSTDSNGKVSIAIPKTLAVKSYTASVTFAGDSSYAKSTKSVSVVVSKAAPKLSAAAKTFKTSDKTKKYTVTLKTDKGAVYKNAKVTVKVNKVTYTVKTNAKGQATFKLTKLTKKGTYSAAVKFAGDSKYKAVSKNVKITVK